MRGLLPCILVSAALAGCASIPDSCVGLTGVERHLLPGPDGTLISQFQYANDSSRVPHLQCQADEGVQAAQLELGIRYETGAGVTRNEARAASLYEKAAAAVPSQTAIYSPPVRLGGAGRIIFLNNPNARTGSAEAMYRLALMYASGAGVAVDAKRSLELMKSAASLGHKDAQNALGTARPE